MAGTCWLSRDAQGLNVVLDWEAIDRADEFWSRVLSQISSMWRLDYLAVSGLYEGAVEALDVTSRFGDAVPVAQSQDDCGTDWIIVREATEEVVCEMVQAWIGVLSELVLFSHEAAQANVEPIAEARALAGGHSGGRAVLQLEDESAFRVLGDEREIDQAEAVILVVAAQLEIATAR